MLYLNPECHCNKIQMHHSDTDQSIELFCADPYNRHLIEIPYTRLLMPSRANIPHRTDLVQCVTAITVTEKDMTETENNLGHAWKSIYSFSCVLSSV